MKASYTKDEIVDVIERAKQKEREYCDEYCRLNSAEAADERRFIATIVIATLNGVLYDLDALNG